MSDITWTTVQRRLGDLVEWAKNPRRLSKHDAEHLQRSLEKFGIVDPLVVNLDNTLIGGHQRKHVLEAAKHFGADYMVDVRVPSRQLTEREAEELGIRLNKNAGEWDMDMLANNFEIPDLLDWGFTADELDIAVEPEGEDPGAQVDRAEEMRAKWGVEPGQLWKLGENRLLIGDCRNSEDINRLCLEKVQGIFTSPPYAEQRKDQYGGVPTDEYVDWWDLVQANAREVLKPDGGFFINIKPHCENGERVLYVFDLVTTMARLWDWKFIDEFCWKRRSYPGSAPNRFKNAFEPVYHFAINATEIKFRPRNVLEDFKSDPGKLKNYKDNPHKKTGNNSPFEVGGKVSYEADGAWPDNFIEAFGDVGKDGHPAAFPVELPEFFIRAFSDEGDIWLDPFGGSGTTMIAAEKHNRKSYLMELLPANGGIIIDRWATMTGQTPERVTE